MADHTTLPSRGLSLRPVGKSSEASELPLGSKPVRLRTSISFTGLPPKSDIRAARQRVRTTSLSASRSAFAVTARSRARRRARLIPSGGPQRNSHAAQLPDERAFGREAYRIL